MLANKQSMRSLVSFLVTWSFVVLTVTGLVLYIVPQGRIAYWLHWSLGGLFIAAGALHLYFNWKTFLSFLAARAGGHLKLKREILVATLLTGAVFAVSVADLPPASWVFDLNEQVKAAWVTSPELEPPFGHAEALSLAAMAKRMRFDLDRALAALQARGIAFDGRQDTLEAIARRNGIRPMDVYAIIRVPEAAPPALPQTREALEAELAGSGLGRKTLAQIATELGVDLAPALQRLQAAGIGATADDTAKAVAEAHERKPIDVVAVMLGVER